jgi:energy-coupling factor transporter ATP-binding protein EcfA2
MTSAIDIAKRFPKTMLYDAYERSKDEDKWVFHETICSSVTLLYGRSGCGKSYLVTSMLLALLKDDREFLGMQPTDRTKLWKPVILWTDPASDDEYGDRLYGAGRLPKDVAVPSFHVGRTVRADEWEVLTDLIISEGYNFVVLDNLMGVTGDTNDPSTITTVFDGLTRLTNRGIPVVVLHHESEHGAVIAGAPPMGHSMSTQKARAWIQVRQTNRRGLRGGNTALVIRANGLDQSQQVICEPLPGPNFGVISRGPWVSREEAAEDKQKQQRSKETLDANAVAADWVVANCQGRGLGDTSRKLEAKFPSRTAKSWSNSIQTGALSRMLSRSGDGAQAAWSRGTD